MSVKVTVEVDDVTIAVETYDGTVNMTCSVGNDDDPRPWLSPDAARALAAVLVHFAAEAEL